MVIRVVLRLPRSKNGELEGAAGEDGAARFRSVVISLREMILFSLQREDSTRSEKVKLTLPTEPVAEFAVRLVVEPLMPPRYGPER